MRYLVLAAMRVFMKTIATNICGKLCRKKYRPTSYRASWLYGMKLSPRQLFILLYCWQTKRSTETAYLLAGVSYTTIQRWFARFRKQLPGSSKLTAMLEGVVQVDESYFGKRRSKQPQHIVVGAKDTTTGAHCPTHYRQPGIGNRLNNLFRITS